jgi:hypothetical protein
VHAGVAPPLARAQARPEAVQKSAALPPPGQQAWPEPPHIPTPLTQLPAVQVLVPPPPPQLEAVAMQLPPTQQAPVDPGQPLLAQHGPGAVPHATTLPAAHTMPVVAGGASPEATQLLLTQQPPPLHFEPGQQASPAAPQVEHCPPEQVPPLKHMVPEPMHWLVVASQQAPEAVQLLPAQQAWPRSPQARQAPPAHARPAPVQASPAQQGCPGPPHCAQTMLLQTVPVPVQLLPGQQAWPGPPQVAQVPAWQETADAVQV